MINPTSAQIVADTLRERILSGDMEPGTRIYESQLAEALGMSATPVREAIQRLADEGLIEFIPRRGTYVKQLTLRDAVEIAELREVLETFVFRKAACNITDDDLARLKELHQAFHDACIKADGESAVQADIAFHDGVAQLANNERLRESLRRLSALRACYHIARYKKDASEHFRDRDDHVPLLEALASRDPDIAEAAIREHVQNAHQRVIRWMEDAREGPDSPKAVNDAAS